MQFWGLKRPDGLSKIPQIDCMYRYHLSEAAAEDIETILAWTMHQFGEQARLRYEELLTQAIDDLAHDPFRPGSASWTEVAASLRVYNIRFSRMRTDGRKRVGRPRHLLLYRIHFEEL